MNSKQELYLVQALKRHEGFRAKPYKDIVGKLTIGYGRNLDDKGVSEVEAGMMLANDVKEAVSALETALPWYGRLDWPRQYVLINMSFNMGLGGTSKGLLSFRNTLELIQSGKYAEAAQNMLKSKWAGQVGPRATELASVMESGRLK